MIIKIEWNKFFRAYKWFGIYWATRLERGGLYGDPWNDFNSIEGWQTSIHPLHWFIPMKKK